MDAKVLIEKFSPLYHLASDGALEAILRHGLLSTASLLELFEVKEPRRRELLEEHRPECVTITHLTHGEAVIRDTMPLDPKRLPKVLVDMTPKEYRRLLNARAFFWVDRMRMEKMLDAYRAMGQTLLIIDTKKLLESHRSNTHLSRINSGTIQFDAPQRGRNTFEDLFAYCYASRREDTPAEVTIIDGVRDISDLLIEAYRIKGEIRKRIWPR